MAVAADRQRIGAAQSRRAASWAPWCVLAVFTLGGVVLPQVLNRGPFDQNLAGRLLPPGARGPDGAVYLFGTDPLGRDMLARLAYGARLSLLVGVLSVLGAGLIGLAIGLVSGYAGGVMDRVLMRLVDLQLSFPFMIMAIGILAVVTPSVVVVIALFVVARWPAYARIVRGSVLEIKGREFVSAARALGARGGRIVLRHVAPSCIGPLLVLASFELAGVIIAESSLGFLGVGIAPPTPTWGNMLAAGRNYVRTAWWLVMFPGLAICLVALSANLIGDDLRDYFDPRLRKR